MVSVQWRVPGQFHANPSFSGTGMEGVAGLPAYRKVTNRALPAMGDVSRKTGRAEHKNRR